MINFNSVPAYTLNEDGDAIWSVLRDPDSLSFAIITAAGSELLKNEGETLSLLVRKYRAAKLGRFALFHSNSTIRHELGRGKEAVVYEMGERFAIREEPGITEEHTAISKLERMNSINSLMEHSLPRWLSLPKHYGLLVDDKTQTTYTLMERINGGVTVEDIINYPNLLSPEKIKTVRNDMGNYIGDAKKKVPLLFEKAYEILSGEIKSKGHEPSHLLTDWKPRNVIVEGHFMSPIAGSNYRLNVIDQYMP